MNVLSFDNVLRARTHQRWVLLEQVLA